MSFAQITCYTFETNVDLPICGGGGRGGIGMPGGISGGTFGVGARVESGTPGLGGTIDGGGGGRAPGIPVT